MRIVRRSNKRIVAMIATLIAKALIIAAILSPSDTLLRKIVGVFIFFSVWVLTLVAVGIMQKK